MKRSVFNDRTGITLSSPQIRCAVEKQLEVSHQSQVKELEQIHDRECSEMMKKLELQAQEEIKDPKEKDKEEIQRFVFIQTVYIHTSYFSLLFRHKREKRSFIVKRALEERRKLDEAHQKKIAEMKKSHDEVKKALMHDVIEVGSSSAAS